VRNADFGCDYCIVDDGSTDRTWKILADLAPRCSVRHGANVGVAGALLTGFKVADQAGYAYVVQCDGDGQHAPGDIPRMLREASTRDVDLVIGSRFDSAAKGHGFELDSTTRIRRLGAQVVNAVLALFGRTARVHDPTSGFRVYSARAVRTLMRVMPDDYPEPESIAILALRGLRIAEVPVQMARRTKGQSSLAGLRSIRYMIKVTSALTGLRLRSLLRTSH
jgi:glycosyltransferase involved in cell wall biosynthesis